MDPKNKTLKTSDGYMTNSAKNMALYKSGALGKPLLGTLPFDPKKPTLVLQKKAPIPNVSPQFKDKDGNYYKTPIS